MSHMVRIIPMLHLLWVDVESLLSRGETGLRRLRVGAGGHGRRGGCQGVHLLLLWVSQMDGLGCSGRCLVLRMLNGAGSRVAASMLITLLQLSCRGGRGLRVLRMRVKGRAWVGKLLRNRGRWRWNTETDKYKQLLYVVSPHLRENKSNEYEYYQIKINKWHIQKSLFFRMSFVTDI